MPDSSPPPSPETTVLFVSPVADFVGGAEYSLFDLLTNPAIKAVLAAPGAGGVTRRAAQLGIPVRPYSYGAIVGVRRPFKMRAVLMAIRDSIRLARHLSRTARDEGADVIHSNGLKVHVVACLSRLFGGPPVFVHIRDIPVNAAERLIWWIFRLFASRVILVSRACWPWPTMQSHVRVIHNGVASSLAALPARRIGLPLTIGFFGRISPFKGLKLLVEWIAHCRGEGLDVRLIVRGRADPRDAAYMTTVHETIAAHHLEEVCRFEGERSGLAAIYENVDVVAVPSNIPDPLPRVVMEGLSLGLPVIGFPAGGIPDMIQHGKTGYLVTSGAEFCAALKDLMQTPGKFESIRRAGHAWVTENMSIDALHRNINQEYLTVTSKRTPAVSDA
jgi:glycosyltransferase involved in cell wall biosynthesis